MPMAFSICLYNALTFIVLLSPSFALSYYVQPGLADSHGPQRHASRSIPNIAPLKVLCIGDSITVGLGDGYPNLENLNNGYRLHLYNLLSGTGINAKFIGTQVSGMNNPQPDMEGYGGQTIDTILSNIQGNNIMSQQPNLVLIHAGTNDDDLAQNSDDPSILFVDAPTRLGNLIDYVLCQNSNATILVAKLIQNKYDQGQTNAFNDQVPVVVGERYMKGFKVRVVDMSMIGGNEMSDLLHPNAVGYSDMANRWFSAILGVPDSWWSTNGEADGALGVCYNECGTVIGNATESIAGACGTGPLPTQITTEVQAPAPTEVTVVGGQTVVQGTNGVQYTLPVGISTPTTITESDGEVFTYIPGGNSLATTFVTNGQTVVQGSLGDQTTLPAGINTNITITESNGEVVTYNPSGVLSPATPVTTNAGGTTVIAQGPDTITVPLGLTVPLTRTVPDGVVFTFTPDPVATLTIGSQIVLSESGQEITLPSGQTTPITTIGGGIVFTFSPSSTISSSTLPAGTIFPISTSVDAPKATNGGTATSCKHWFFFMATGQLIHHLVQ